MAATEIPWTDVLIAWGTLATALILLGAGAIAWWQATEARRLRRAQIRPFVVIDFEAQEIPPLIFLQITNFGSILASNVNFEFEPRLASSLDTGGRDLPDIADLSILKNGIPSLPPGKKISFLFDSAIQRRNLPNTYAVTVRYEGEELKRFLRKPRRATYTEPLTLDLDMYWDTTRIDRRGLHDIHKQLEEIKNEIKKWRL